MRLGAAPTITSSSSSHSLPPWRGRQNQFPSQLLSGAGLVCWCTTPPTHPHSTILSGPRAGQPAPAPLQAWWCRPAGWAPVSTRPPRLAAARRPGAVSQSGRGGDCSNMAEQANTNRHAKAHQQYPSSPHIDIGLAAVFLQYLELQSSIKCLDSLPI